MSTKDPEGIWNIADEPTLDPDRERIRSKVTAAVLLVVFALLLLATSARAGALVETFRVNVEACTGPACVYVQEAHVSVTYGWGDKVVERSGMTWGGGIIVLGTFPIDPDWIRVDVKHYDLQPHSKSVTLVDVPPAGQREQTVTFQANNYYMPIVVDQRNDIAGAAVWP